MNSLIGTKIMASTFKQEFLHAVARVSESKSKVQISHDELLHIYALYKQSIEGDAPENAPWVFNVEKRAKWNAWNSLRGKTRDAAMQEYIAAVKPYI